VKLVLVTGGAKRLGRALVQGFADAGYACLVHANQSAQEAQALCQQIRDHGGQAHAVLCAIDDAAHAANALLDASEKLFGRLPDASVLSAASCDLDASDRPLEATVYQQMELNFAFPAAYCAALARRLGAADAAAGAVLPSDATPHPRASGNFAGVAAPSDAAQHPRASPNAADTGKARDGLRGGRHDYSVTLLTDYKVAKVNAELFSYSLSKHALEGVLPYLTVAFARQLRVNAIAPGPITAAHGPDPQTLRALVQANNVSGDYPRSEDIVDTALFLARTVSLYGQHIFVDAGARFDAGAREYT